MADTTNTQFIERSLNATAWQWVFGDGALATGPRPNHSFPAPGAYVTSLIATNDSGASLVQKAIIVLPCKT